MHRLTITAAALAAGLLAQTQGFTQVPSSTGPGAGIAQDAPTTSDPEQVARKTWRAVMANTRIQGKGCFHASYPNVAWESQACKVAKPHDPPVHVKRTVGAPEAAGNDGDYVAQAQGLVTFAAGQFSESGVTSETGVPACQECIVDGQLPNEYSLQINTNADQYSAACGDYSNCLVWQQFIYATDYFYRDEAELFMEYWLFNWTGRCPNGWTTSGNSCYRNSNYASLPDIPVTQLSQVTFYGAANGAGDSVGLQYGDDVWVVTANDSSSDNDGSHNDTSGGGVDISSVWTQVEFNVVGDGNYAKAIFNPGAQFNVLLTIEDGSRSAPTCLPPQDLAATTGESNNLSLGACQTGVGNTIYLGCGDQDDCVPAIVTGPYIEFSERRPPLIEVTCIVCRLPVVGAPISLQVSPQQYVGSSQATSARAQATD
jgi:hypothetical protein